MKAKCVTRKDNHISKDKFPVNNPREYLEVGKIYNIYGILYSEGHFFYLIDREFNKNDKYSVLPSWEPIELFEIVNAKLPMNWYFTRFVETIYKEKLLDSSSTIWGYKELVLDEDHNDKLLDRDYEHIKIFIKRKKEIDEWEEQNK